MTVDEKWKTGMQVRGRGGEDGFGGDVPCSYALIAGVREGAKSVNVLVRILRVIARAKERFPESFP